MSNNTVIFIKVWKYVFVTDFSYAHNNNNITGIITVKIHFLKGVQTSCPSPLRLWVSQLLIMNVPKFDEKNSSSYQKKTKSK